MAVPSTVAPSVAHRAIWSDSDREPHRSATPQGSFQASRENSCQA